MDWMVSGMTELERLIVDNEDVADVYMADAEHCSDSEKKAMYIKAAEGHRQLATYLRELQEIRKDRDYWKEKAHSYEQTILKLTDAISKQPEIITGEWELKDHQWECGKCGCRINVKNPLDCDKWNYYYCPHCGTKNADSGTERKIKAERRINADD